MIQIELKDRVTMKEMNFLLPFAVICTLSGSFICFILSHSRSLVKMKKRSGKVKHAIGNQYRLSRRTTSITYTRIGL